MAGRTGPVGRRRTTLIAAAGLALVLSPLVAGAAPLTAQQLFEPVGSYRFCADAQLDIANIDEPLMLDRGISVTTITYGSYDSDLVNSKSGVDVDGRRIVTTSGIRWLDAAKTEPEMIRCKMRTGESLDEGAWPAGADNNSGRFAVDPYYGFGAQADGVSTDPVDRSCSYVNQRTIDGVWSTLTPEQRAASPYSPEGPAPTIVTDPDELALAGPLWLEEKPVLVDVLGTLHVRSQALVVPTGTFIPRFEGAHYCTFVAPQYLREVLLGSAEVA